MSTPSEELRPDAPDGDVTNYQQATPSADPEASVYDGASPTPGPGAPSWQRGRNLPRRFGEFELQAEIARGGMGIVYKAKELKAPHRTVALKMILGGEHAAAGAFERFQVEASLTADWDHPGIVRIHEVGECDGQAFYTMQLIDGGSLQELVQKQGPLPPGEAVRLLRLVSEAVQYAHERGVIHRDIKPHNVLLASGGRESPVESATGDSRLPLARTVPKLTDFGLARTREGGHSVTGEQLGTPSYMSPEQAAGKVREVSPRTDVYSLGAVLYFLLTGRPPFQSGSAVDTMRLVLEQEAVSVRVLNPSVPRDLETVCLKCLEKPQEKRYGSARELAEELGRYERGESVLAQPVGSLEKAWRWSKRNRLVAGLMAGVVTLLLFAAGQSLVVRSQAVEQARKDRDAAAEAERLVKHANDAVTQANINADLANSHKATAETARNEAKVEAETNKRLRNEAERDRDRLAYADHLRLAEGHWEQGNAEAANDSLDDARAIWRKGAGAGETVPWELSYLHGLVAAPERTLLGHTSYVNSVSFSPDGKRFASGSSDHTVKVWDAQSGQELLTLKGHFWAVYSVSYSPDGTRIASGSNDNTVKVWDAQSGQELLTLKGHTSEIRSVSYSPDGKRIVSGSSDKTVRVWDAQSGQKLLTFNGHMGSVTCVSYSPDGKRIASGNFGLSLNVGDAHNATVKVWDAQTGQEFLTFKGHRGSVESVSYSPDGKRIASGSIDQTVKVWDAQTGQESLTFKGHTSVVKSLSYSPDGKRIASAGDGTVKVWDAQSGQEVLTLKGHTNDVSSVSYSPNGKRIASGSDDKKVKVWDARSGQEYLTLKGHTSEVRCVSYSLDGKRIASGSDDKTVKVWDAQGGQELLTLKGHTGSVRSVNYSPEGKRIASGSEDKTVKVWDAHSGQELLTLKGHTRWIHSVSYSPDGKRIASGNSDKTLKVWDAQSGQELLTLKGHTDSVHAVSYSPDGKRIVSGSGDKTVKVWDAQSGQKILTLTGHTSYVSSVSYSPDGKRIVSGSGDKTVKVWDAQTGQDFLTLKQNTSYVRSVSFSPDAKRIASGSEDGTVRVWEAQSGQTFLNLKVYTPRYSTLSYSPDGKRIACGSEDKTVKVWDAHSGEELLTLKGHTDTVQHVSYSPDGKRIISSDKKNTKIVWEASTGKRLDESVTELPDARQTSPDGKFLALAEGDAVRAFNLRDPTAIQAKTICLQRLARPDLVWHGEQASESLKAGNIFAVAFHLAYLARINDEQTQDPFQRGLIALHVRLAEQYVAAASAAWAKLAEDLSVAEQDRRELIYLGRFAPLRREEAHRLLKLTEELVRKEKSAYHLDYLGAAQYRAGRYEEAVRTLEESIQKDREGWFIAAKLFLAMSYKQLRRDNEARRYYAEFAEWYKNQSFQTWEEQIRWQRLNEEARRLILTMPAAE